MDSLEDIQSSDSSAKEDLPPRLPTKFHACVRKHESAERVKSQLSKYSTPITTHENDNIPAVEAADVIILGCKPYMVEGLLKSKGMFDALQGKLLLSICAGLTEARIYAMLYEDHGLDVGTLLKGGGTRVIRVMPNTAAAVRESMTVICDSEITPPPETSKLVDWIFTRIGRTVRLPASNMDASTALCGSGPAFMALVLEAAADGAVAMGLPRKEAQMMAAQTMRGMAGLVLSGEHPAVLRDKVSTPGGCTIGGLLVLEEGRVRGSVARAVRQATVVASHLGKGAQGVNGPPVGGSMDA